MNSQPQCSQRDMFATPTAVGQSLVLELKGIEVPPSKKARENAQKSGRALAPNYHVPSKKNCKTWLTKLPNGKPLKRPLLITKPEYQRWTEKALQHLESALLSRCQTGRDETPQVRSKLCAILSLLFADDSVRELIQGSWTVQIVPPGEEGATIEITRLS